MGINWFQSLASRRLALSLFLLLVLLLIPASFLTRPPAPLTLAVRGALALLGMNLIACTILHWRRLSGPVRLLHAGSLLVLVGGGYSSFSAVATVNLHEKTSTATAFRWERQQEMPLDYELRVEEIGQTYYPVAVKIGLLRAGQKVELLTGNTGQDLYYDRFRIVASEFDPEGKSLRLAIYDRKSDLLLGQTTTGAGGPENGLPLQFQLVAYQQPVVQRVWVELRIIRDGQEVAAGRAEANHPFLWSGERFFLTAIDRDRFGLPYAGLQIVRDPAVPIVYGGFAVILLGALALLIPKRGRLFPSRRA